VKTIVSGEFGTEIKAARAVDKLLRACVRGEHIRAYFVPERSARRMPARRIDVSGRSSHPRRPPASIELDIGPGAQGDGVPLHAYVRHPSPLAARDRRAPSAPSAILVAVETTDQVSQTLALNVLREHGAESIERAAEARHLPPHDCCPVALSALLGDPPTPPSQTRMRAAGRH
jgi:hypothetical protein